MPPIVSCREHEPFERLPAYPVGPITYSDKSTLAYSSAQSVWAAEIAGITKRNTIKRNATATCLDALRARGLIL